MNELKCSCKDNRNMKEQLVFGWLILFDDKASSHQAFKSCLMFILTRSYRHNKIKH